jgi:hypothetical protein
MTSRTRIRPLVAGLAVVALGIPLAACGGSSSSKPGYCDDKAQLQADIKNLPNDLKSGGISSLKTSLQKVESDVRAVVSGAKDDFPSETQALSSSITSLKTSVQSLGSSPSVESLLGLGPQVQSAVDSVKAFTDAAGSKC